MSPFVIPAMQPRIFISAVTSELGHARQLAANVMQRLGYTPVWQEIFGFEAGEVLKMLREKIDSCEGVLHLVGRAYGAEPPQPDLTWGRISYTQYEYLYGQQQGKNVWVVLTLNEYPQDRPLEELDLPTDNLHPDPKAYQSERRHLQDAWRERLHGDRQLWHSVSSRIEFELKLEKLRDEFAELRRGFQQWQDSVTRKLDAITPALNPAGAMEASRNRSAMLAKIRTDWVNGGLTASIYDGRRIALRFSEMPSAVERSLDWLVERPGDQEVLLPEAVDITAIYDHANGAVLILGLPGAGKTDQLLELTQVLLNRADADPVHPIPVIFPLSTWATTQKPIEDWLVDELHLRYDVPATIGQEWIDRNQVLPLLDGLDEQDARTRVACVRAINSFRKSRGLLPLVVTSRAKEYEQTGEKLHLHTAVRIHALTRDQIISFLRTVDEGGKPSLELLAQHAGIWELLDNPLFLDVFIRSNRKTESANPEIPSERYSQPRAIFDRYLKSMLGRRAVGSRFRDDSTTRWLTWLASEMTGKGLTVFHVERIQFDWLPAASRDGMIVASDCFVYALVFMVLCLAYCIWLPLQDGVVLGLFVGSLVLPGYSRGRKDVEISPVDRVIATRIFSTFMSAASGAMARCLFWGTVVCGPISGILGGLLAGLMTSSSAYGGFQYLLVGAGVGLGGGFVIGGLIIGVIAGVLSGVQAVVHGLSFAEVETTSMPNQGIRRSQRNAVVAGLFATVVGTVVAMCIFIVPIGIYCLFSAPQSSSLIAKISVVAGCGTIGGLPFGLFVAGRCGGAAVLRHYFLRGCLSWCGKTPLDLVAFLDYAADRLLLRKVGGGYTFIHRLFRDHLAEASGTYREG